ncbi:MAG: hypothetical protein LH609_10395 [Rudanella sp.]|nr:hypothetical protein [Rudanella sp.]
MKAPLLLLALLLVASSATAQRSDTLRTETTTEDARISAAEVKRFIRYITRADMEERTLFKVGIWPTTDRGQGTFEYRRFRVSFLGEMSVEKKLSPSVSFVIGGEANSTYIKYKGMGVLSGYGLDKQPIYLQQVSSTEFLWKAGFRYYYAKAKDIKHGRSANNFSGNYIALKYLQPFHRIASTKVLDLNTNKPSPRQSDRRIGNLLGSPSPRLMLAYGIQRRLGKFAYFDIDAGPHVQFGNGSGTTFSFQLNAFLGFGW